MAYREFTFKKIIEEFNLKIEYENIFDNIQKIDKSDWLNQTLEYGLNMPLVSEKARSEFIIAPILIEFQNKNKNKISIFSGKNFIADKSKKLNGECDFILTLSNIKSEIIAPIFTIVEAKQEKIDNCIGQCIAQMIGAKIFNENSKSNISDIYGCVTTGEDWLFLKLDIKNNIITISNKKYYIDDVESILGIFQNIINKGN